ncbi:GNAT family N-acetyltransferase [Pseudarthrobacter sp. J1738]|uniref:GNAT family N-acetyltransferase n=1 Tax=unclassified Pseudarthrobacter TaxID=2647000 RepID=UPI003D2AF059
MSNLPATTENDQIGSTPLGEILMDDFVEGIAIARLHVLPIADRFGEALGWCGIQRFPIYPGSDPQWLIAGLTVLPKVRRQGIAVRLLSEVIQATPKSAPAEAMGFGKVARPGVLRP